MKVAEDLKAIFRSDLLKGLHFRLFEKDHPFSNRTSQFFSVQTFSHQNKDIVYENIDTSRFIRQPTEFK